MWERESVCVCVCEREKERLWLWLRLYLRVYILESNGWTLKQKCVCLFVCVFTFVCLCVCVCVARVCMCALNTYNIFVNVRNRAESTTKTIYPTKLCSLLTNNKITYNFYESIFYHLLVFTLRMTKSWANDVCVVQSKAR